MPWEADKADTIAAWNRRAGQSHAAGLLQAEQIAEFTKARGVAPPERIWLVYEAGGETVWSAEPDPEGNGEPSVGYALERAGQAYAAGLLEALEAIANNGWRDQSRAKTVARAAIHANDRCSTKFDVPYNPPKQRTVNDAT
jgi:hypothetical protein